MIKDELFLPMGEPTCSKLTNCYISRSKLRAMAAGDASQTTPVQIMHALCCVVLNKSSMCNSCKNVTGCVLIN